MLSEKRKEQQRKAAKKYRLKNIEKVREYDIKYKLENKEAHAKQYKEYSNTPNGLKVRRICQWKRRGVITDDWDMLHQHYLLTSHCEECHVYLEGKKGDRKCLDHCHTTGEFRNILCHVCNFKRG